MSIVPGSAPGWGHLGWGDVCRHQDRQSALRPDRGFSVLAGWVLLLRKELRELLARRGAILSFFSREHLFGSISPTVQPKQLPKD